ncbi:tetratricopeptide repeat protein [Sphingomonas sabuli]|uniref:Tetratricopeptide repeat protein n=1 Tax=Sphingomonas sabuli TaxID=2764186 RepID=A0A7G9L445_9SPHN|nr:tetratricopeptide repeat protein [Sphingomonas sabuli]QNM83394.1 tetratricopeptide repeat protein [Sphingomonas sabuli]
MRGISDPAKAYIEARAASISGRPAQAAEILATLAEGSANPDLRDRAVYEAMSAGDMKLALRLLKTSPRPAASFNAKLLLVAEALKERRDAEAIRLLGPDVGGPDLSFWTPLVRAWNAAERKDTTGALTILSEVPANSALKSFVDEQAAFMLLRMGRPSDAPPYVERALSNAGPREYRLRLVLAEAYRSAGDEQHAIELIDKLPENAALLRRSLQQGRLKPLAINSSATAFADQLLALAMEIRRSPRAATPPLLMVQVARYAAPQNSATTILLGSLLGEEGRIDDALAALRSVPADDPLKPEAIDSESRALLEEERLDEALALAQSAVARPGATGDDFARLGDVYGELERHDEAAAAYAQAIERLSQAGNSRLWPLLLLRGSELEKAGRWPESKAVLNAAVAMAPNEPLILNFLGYSKLEHGEDLDAAEALVRKASELAPDNASITDSLGWALYKRGRYDEAIDILQSAAIADPVQAEIHEHLGDALYAAGRRFEARFAWEAALATAAEADVTRIRSKIATGLTQATAAR